MLELSQTQLVSLSVHQVGNRANDEGYQASARPYHPDENLREVLLRYFLKPFQQATDFYRFHHEDGLEHHVVYQLAAGALDQTQPLHENSVHLLEHLYAQSDHPHIKRGDVFVARLEDCVVEGELVNALGIFKAESVDTILQLEQQADQFKVHLQQGIPVKKLDKGCLIFHTEQDAGFRVLTVDNNHYDARYWKENFLGLRQEENDHYHTQQYLDMCEEFSNDYHGGEHERQEQMAFLNRSVDYFANNDRFNEQEFQEIVLEAPEAIADFNHFKERYQEHAGATATAQPEFDISDTAVSSARKKMKKAIRLDTHIQIQLDLFDDDPGHRYIEKGFDSDKGMHFYKVYFNHEV
ncbi:MAG: nucleoid-associated protein [Bacteroidota bacterium]